MAVDAGLLSRIGLASGERVIWQGQPGRGLRFGWQDLPISLFMLLWVSIPAKQLFSNDGGGPDLLLWVFVAVAFYVLVLRFLVDAYRRAHCDYVLTNRRAIILQRGIMPQTQSIALSAIPNITLREGRNGSGTVAFNLNGAARTGRRGVRSAAPGDTGFRFVPDARRVYDLMTRAQNEAGW